MATGVLLSTGEEIHAKAVISNADPKRTLLKLTDPDVISRRTSCRDCSTIAAMERSRK